MSWVRIDDQLPGHPKFLEVDPAAGWLWLCGLTYCARYKTDGFIRAAAVPALCPKLSPPPTRLIDSLLAAGLWKKAKGGFRVHNYLKYNLSAKEIDAKAEGNRRRQGTWRAKQAGQATNAAGNALSSRYPSHPGNASPDPSRPNPKRHTPPSPPEGGVSNLGDSEDPEVDQSARAGFFAKLDEIDSAAKAASRVGRAPSRLGSAAHDPARPCSPDRDGQPVN